MEKVMKCNRKIKTEKRRKYPKEEKAKNKQRNMIYEISNMVKIRKKERKTENKTGI